MGLHAETIGAGVPRLVCSHGFTQTGRSWLPVVAPLTRRHEIVLVDLPGHGASGDEDADLWDAASLVGAAGGRGVHVGYSMGGRVALHLALSRPALVDALVLVGATAGIDDADERAARRDADERLAAAIERDGVEVFLERWLAQPLFARLARDASGVEDRRRNSAAGLAASLRHTGTGTQDPLWDRLGALSMPVLVVAGALDRKFTALGRRLAESIGANARFTAIDGAGHPAHLEQPERFRAVLQAFASGRGSAA